MCTSFGALKRRVAAEPWPVISPRSLASRALGLYSDSAPRRVRQHGLIRAVSFVTNDSVHIFRRNETGYTCSPPMLSLAQLLQIGQALGIRQRAFHCSVGARKIVTGCSALISTCILRRPGRVIRQPRMIVRGSRRTLSHSRSQLKTRCCWPNDGRRKHKSTKSRNEGIFVISHSNPFSARPSLPQVSHASCLVRVSDQWDR